MESLWSETSSLPEFDFQKEDKKTDVLIIGGGMAGVLCAYFLNKENVDYLLVEANTIGKGVTKNTTAKITSQHGLIYAKILGSYGLEKAAMYLRVNQAALAQYEKLCRDIDCNYEEKDHYVYTLDDPRKIEKEVSALHRMGFPGTYCDHLPLPIDIAAAVRFSKQAQFHPLKFLSGISKGLNILEHTEVCGLEGTTARTNHGKIDAKKIIIATHFPILNKHGGYFIKMYQHRSYVTALKNAEKIEGMYVDEAQKGMSFRNHDDLLLIGGGDHRTGKKGGNWDELRDFAACYYPKSQEKYAWATQDCMTLDSIPYIGPYSKNTENLYVATGFNKWGMTSSMAAAMILCDMVLDRKSDGAEVFSPSRSVFHPQLGVNALEAVANLLTPTVPRCPHLGCALKWNGREHSWDCPCHGSRFTKGGHLLDNPATGNLKRGK